MLGKIITGKSFAGCLEYCLNDKRQQPGEEQVMKDRAEVILYNQCGGNQKELISQFNEVRQLNKKVSKPVMHFTLSLSPGEQLTKDKWMDICQDCAKDLGFDKNQYVAILHKDTDHQHVHIVANRVGYDGRAVSDSRNYQKMATFCRKMEQKHNLKQVQSPRQFMSPRDRLQPRQNQRLDKLRADIQQTLLQVKTYEAFEQKMKSLGYQVLKGRGIAFIDDKKVKMKGSEVGFSLMKIEKILALKQQQELLPRQQHAGSDKPHSNPSRPPAGNNQLAGLEQSSEKELAKDAADLLEILLKPEYTDNTTPEWLKQRKKKKKQLRPRF